MSATPLLFPQSATTWTRTREQSSKIQIEDNEIENCLEKRCMHGTRV